MDIYKWIIICFSEISLVATMAELDVYRIYKHPVPLNDSTGHTTELKDTREYVAFSTDQKYYCFPQQFMFKDSLLNVLHITKNLHCTLFMMYLYVILYYDLGIVLEWSWVKVLIDIMLYLIISRVNVFVP